MTSDSTTLSADGTPTDSGRNNAIEATPSAAASAPRRTRRPRVRIGVIADTHGYLDSSVCRVFAGVDHIVVAGDVLDPEILKTLGGIAPVTAVRGAADVALAASLPQEATGEIGGVRFAVGHSSKRLLKRLSSGRVSVGAEGSMPDLVIYAAAHKPSVTWIDGILFLNPGTASSPDREDDDPTVAIVEREATGLTARFVPLRRRPAEKPTIRRALVFRGGIMPTMMESEERPSRGRKAPR